MLDNLRGMAVFAAVVNSGSFSGAAKDLGITTSAVSQQIRALETDFGVMLLHRSTRKLSLTEAGEQLYTSAQEIVRAAESGRATVSQLREDLAGSLRLATTPELARNYIFPALSDWLLPHGDLSLSLITHDGKGIDMIDERVDISINFAPKTMHAGVPLARTPQLLLASPKYFAKYGKPSSPKDLTSHKIIAQDDKDGATLEIDKIKIKMAHKYSTNNVAVALALAEQGYGLVQVSKMEAKAHLDSGALVSVLDAYFPEMRLYAVMKSRRQQPAKVWRCLEVLTAYFERIDTE